MIQRKIGSQRLSPHLGIYFKETYILVVNISTIQIFLSIAISQRWILRQLDVNNAFLQGKLDIEVYMSQPSGFVNKDRPNYVCKLEKSYLRPQVGTKKL